PAALLLAPASLAFFSSPGISPSVQNFQVTNSGSGTLNWTTVPSTTSGGNWLSVAPTSGSAPSTVTVTVNSDALSAGNYTGKVTVSGSGISNSPQVLNVALTVGAQPAISFSPNQLFFSTTPGNNPPL